MTATPANILVARDGPVAVVTLNRPEQMNAFNEELHREAERLWPRLAEDRDIRAIVITGAGKAFSAGGDLKAIARRLSDPQENFRTSIAVPSSALKLLRGLLDIPQPVIARSMVTLSALARRSRSPAMSLSYPTPLGSATRMCASVSWPAMAAPCYGRFSWARAGPRIF